MFDRSRTDRLFRRFCRSGDPAALAAVFDSTAGELHRVASYLTGDRHAADDLVQDTFLVAIEQRGRFDRTRPVLPWLLGVLANLARRRRTQLWRAAESLAAAQEPAADDDPALAAAARGLAAALRRGVRGLPEPYRGVLIRHLEDGMPAHAIAAECGAVPSTVRNQVMRGMELLRRALPAGFAGAAFVALPSLGLAAVRSTILARASTTAPATTAVAPLLSIMVFAMKKAILLAAGLLVAVCAWWAATTPSADGPGKPPNVASLTAPLEPRVGPETPAARGVPAPAPTRTPAPESVATRGSLVVRVRFAGDGAPAADAGLYVRAADGSRFGVERRTDSTGVARFDDLAAGDYLVMPDRCAAARVAIEAGAVRDLAIAVPAGVTVDGRVVDVDKQPVGGARIYAKRREHHEFFQFVATAGPEGRFTLRDVAPDTALLARAEGYQPSHHARSGAVAGVPGTRRELTMTLGARAHRLFGKVVGEDGAPVPYALVTIAVDEDVRKRSDGVVGGRRKPDGLLDREEVVLRCDAEGRFASHEVPVGEAALIARPDDGRDASIAALRIVVQPEVDNRVQLRLGPGAIVEGTVRDETGKPFAGLPLLIEWKGNRELGSLEGRLGHVVAARTAVTDHDGRFRLTGLLPGQHELMPGGAFDDRLGIRRGRAKGARFELAPLQVLRWDGVVSRTVPLRVRVLGPDLAPLAGFAVHVGEVHTHLLSSRALREHRTDAAGHCVVPGVPDGPLTVSVHGPRPDTNPDEMPACVVEGVRGGADDVEIRVPSLPTAELRGRVAGGSGPQVVLRREEYRVSRTVSPDRATGGFELVGLPAGSYFLTLECGSCPRGACRRIELAAGQRLDIGEILVPEARFATLQFADAAQAAAARADIVDAAGDHFSSFHRVATGLRSPALVPGRHVAFVQARGWREGEEPAFAPLAVELEVLAGRDVVVPIALTAGIPTTVEIVAPVPLTSAKADVALHMVKGAASASVGGGPTPVLNVSGDPTRARFELPLAPGTYILVVRLQGLESGSVPVVLGATASERAVVRVVLR